jgi:beta-mannanase
MVSEIMEVPGVPVVQLGLLHSRCEDVISGKSDSYLKQFAQGSVEYGKQHGGFFMSPMWEMNLPAKDSWAWAGQPTQFRKAWRHIWQIFEDQGANEYATWAIEYHVLGPLPEYDPGSKYVDWIGLSAYARASHPTYRSLDELIREPYNYFRSRYPNKPLMLEEFGTTNGYKQPMWLQDAYQTIKKLTGIKAAICWNVVDYQVRDDDTLSQQSFQTLKEIFKDPYWITAK